MKEAANVLTVLIVAPIWFYLVHWMLVRLEAGELQMFLFWVYLPASFAVRFAMGLAEKKAAK